jgi:hypothetical protein
VRGRHRQLPRDTVLDTGKVGKQPVGEDLADGRVIREGLRVGKASRILLGERTNLLLLCTARPS